MTLRTVPAVEVVDLVDTVAAMDGIACALCAGTGEVAGMGTCGQDHVVLQRLGLQVHADPSRVMLWCATHGEAPFPGLDYCERLDRHPCALSWVPTPPVHFDEATP